MLHYTDRYPPPDPSDPFAPLSVLRNRTCNGAQNPQHQLIPDLPLPFDQRRQSGSFLLLPAQPITRVGSLDITISATTPRSEEKPAHYKPRSQSIYLLPSLSASNLPQYTRQQAKKSYRPFPNTPFDNSDTSGTDSDTNASQHGHKHPSNDSHPRAKPSPGRFTRFLLAKKPSLLGNSGNLNDSQIAAVAKQGIRKTSISPPLISTVLWESQDTAGRFVPITVNPIFNNAVSVFSNSDTVSLDTQDVAGHRSSPGNDHHTGEFIEKAQLIDLADKLNLHLKPMKQLSSSSSAPLAILKRRPISLTPLSTATNSISSSSYINISTPVPSPSLSYNPSASEDAYISPRPAPRPPPSPYLQGPDPKTECSSTECSNPSQIPLAPQTEWSMPSPAQLALAATLPLLTAEGQIVPFGSLFTNHRTIVIFIRHFWCPLCQDYMTALTSLVRKAEFKDVVCNFNEGDTAGLKQVQLAVVSNGAQGMIEKYRQIFELPFKVYTDPELKVYEALGMGKDGVGTKDELDRQVGLEMRVNRRATLEKDEKEVDEMLERASVRTREKEGRKDGGYVKHGLMGGIAMVVVRALRVGMPVWEKGGDIAQLGGEFVLGPGLTCSFAHRMQTTKDHAPIQEVLKAAGVHMPEQTPTPTPSLRLKQKNGTEMGITEKLHRKRSSISEWTRTARARRRQSMTNTTLIAETWGWQSSDNHTVVGELTDVEEDEFDGFSQGEDEEQKWMDARQRALDRLRKKRDARRGGVHSTRDGSSETSSTTLTDSPSAQTVHSRSRSLSASVKNVISQDAENS